MSTKRQGLTALFAASMLLTAGGATAQTATPAAVKNGEVGSASTEIAPPINLVIGKSTILRLPAPAARVSVGNPVVADINLINPREAYLLGKEIGSTNLIIWGRDGTATVIDVTVNIDAAALQTTMRQLLPDEPDVTVDLAYDSVVLKGEVADALKVDRAVAIADAFVRKFNRSLVADVQMPGSDKGVSVSLGGSRDSGAAVRVAGASVVNMLRIRAPQQVMLEVKIAEINKTLAENLGFDFARQFTGGGGAWTKTISGIVGGKASEYLKNINATQKIAPLDLRITGPLDQPFTLPINVPGAAPDMPPITLPGGAPVTIDGLQSGMLQQTNTNMATQDFTSWLIDAQKTDGLVKILAEPNIVAISGQAGSFLAGGEIMIPVPGADGTVTLQSKTFGVGLSFTPTVLDGGRINIKVAPEVSDFVGFNTVASTALGAQSVVPTFTTRRVNTTVQLAEGQSLAIGGLLQDNFREQVKRFPILGEIPVLGALFRSSEYRKEKSELLVVVTPRLVKPLAPNYVLPTDGFVEPSRSELLFEGKMEGKKSDSTQSEHAGTAPAAEQPALSGFEMN
jgi:pilus assembly protein CpaC